MLFFSALTTRRTTAVAAAVSPAVRSTSCVAIIPRRAAAITEPCRAMPSPRPNSKRIGANAHREQRGTSRTRANCLPSPCSSMTAVTRTEPNDPRASSKSHRSYAPPRMTRAPVARRAFSSERSQSSCALHCSLHILQIWMRGHAQPSSRRRRQGLRPLRSRPSRRQSG